MWRDFLLLEDDMCRMCDSTSLFQSLHHIKTNTLTHTYAHKCSVIASHVHHVRACACVLVWAAAARWWWWRSVLKSSKTVSGTTDAHPAFKFICMCACIIFNKGANIEEARSCRWFYLKMVDACARTGWGIYMVLVQVVARVRRNPKPPYDTFSNAE